MRKISRIVVHCSDTESGNVDSIRRYHVSHNGWNDVGYHFVITRDGTIEPGRPLSKAGAHVSGANYDSIGICLIGKNDFKPHQFEALRDLVAALKAQFGGLSVFPHNVFPSAKKQGKTCPNFDVEKVLKEEV